MPIPDLDPATGYLPPGLHTATLAEIRIRFGTTRKRLQLLAGLEWAAAQLFSAGVLDLRIDGSFVTEKPEPGDIDGFWVYEPTVRWNDIPPILRDFTTVTDPSSREPKFRMWFKYGIELWVHPLHWGATGKHLPEFFSHSRDGAARGYIRVRRERKKAPK